MERTREYVGLIFWWREGVHGMGWALWGNWMRGWTDGGFWFCGDWGGRGGSWEIFL